MEETNYESRNNLIDGFVEVSLEEADDFLVVKETLSRMGTANKKKKQLYQNCFILHKKGKFYIVHYKELMLLDGCVLTMTKEDINVRNRCVNLLNKWGLLKTVDPMKSAEDNTVKISLHVVPHSQKNDWDFVVLYDIGNIQNTFKEFYNDEH